jgi:hypothetical protein
LKTKWSDNTLSSSKSVLTKFKQLKMLLKKLAIKYSRDSRLKSCNDVLRKNSRKTLETNYTSKKANLLPALVSRLISISVNVQSKSYKKPKSSK